MFSLRSAVQTFLPHLYTTFAALYDLVAAIVSLGQWREWQRTALDPLEDRRRVLELGPGTGHMLLDLAKDGRFVVGVDASTQMTRIASARLKKAGLPARVVQARVQALPFPKTAFDAALSTFPTPYILDPRTRAELSRVIQEGGRFVIILEALITSRRPLDRLLAWLIRATGAEFEPTHRWLEPWQANEFSADLQRVRLPRAVVFRAVVDKLNRR
jgi:ubiquinone/menaquinone biosynthesis C-methylase UbiE